MIRAALTSLAVALGSIVPSIAPAQAATDWTVVSAGGNHTCGIRAGELYCWGANDAGQVGLDTDGANVWVPTKISVANDWKTVSAGVEHTCAIRSIGKLYCWGESAYGQLGFNNGGANVLAPHRVTSAEDWKSVDAGAHHTCAIRSVGKLYCWGNNPYGQVGFNSGGTNVTTPTSITSAEDWKTVTAGATHSCAIRSTGKLYCWGNNGNGQVGFPLSAGIQTPTKVTSADDWKTVSAGGSSSCAIRSTGKLYCWGDNSYGQDGFSTSTPFVTTPTRITSADDWRTVTAGGFHGCGIRSVGKLYCWGYNMLGEVGFNSGGAAVTTPTKITTADDWKSTSAGDYHSCGIRSVGRLYCWGRNAFGEIGFNKNSGSPVTSPTEVGTPSSALSTTKPA